MTTDKRKGLAVLAEVVAVLARHTRLRVTPTVDMENGVMSLVVTATADGDDGLQVLALADELKYVQDVATVRAICGSYNIKPEQLEALLPAMQDDTPPGHVRHLTVEEIDAVVYALVDGGALGQRAELLDTAVPKLVSLARALSGAV